MGSIRKKDNESKKRREKPLIPRKSKSVKKDLLEQIHDLPTKIVIYYGIMISSFRILECLFIDFKSKTKRKNIKNDFRYEI